MSVCSALGLLVQSVNLTVLPSGSQTSHLIRKMVSFQFVSGGKGLVGIHGTAWWIGGRAVDLIGGHANWHPPGGTFTVNIDDSDHPITQGVGDFEVEDEIYMSAYDPYIHILASAEWSEKQHPLAWVKSYGDGRVFYTALGHGPGTFEQPAMQTLMATGCSMGGKQLSFKWGLRQDSSDTSCLNSLNSDNSQGGLMHDDRRRTLSI